jgi:hypothetical protein
MISCNNLSPSSVLSVFVSGLVLVFDFDFDLLLVGSSS